MSPVLGTIVPMSLAGSAGRGGRLRKKSVSDRSVPVQRELFSWFTLNKALLCTLEYLVVKGHAIESFNIVAK